ncbi:MAG: ABC transporter permease [Eubacteriales bacterium]
MKKYTSKIAAKPWFSIAVAFLILCIISSFIMPAFLQLSNFRGVLITSTTTGIMAVGLTFVIMTGGIDISIGGIVYLTAIIYCVTMNTYDNVAMAVVFSIGAASIAGIVNGYLVYKFKMAPMITTLATCNIFKGVGLTISGGRNYAVPSYATFWGKGTIAGISIPILIMIVVILIGIYLFAKTRFGTYVRAIGNSEASAAESHLPVRNTLMEAYFLAGITSGIAGIIYVSRVGGLQGNLGSGIEFTVIAAVVLGGTKLIGGSGTIVGSIIGAIFLVIIDNVLAMLGASTYVFEAVRGAILLFAVMADRAAYVRQFKAMRHEKFERIRATSKH